MVTTIGGLILTTERYIGCNEDYGTHTPFMCVGSLLTCSSVLDKREWQHRRTTFFVSARQVPSHDFYGENPMSSLWLYLAMALSM
jgi:hypothetical protein